MLGKENTFDDCFDLTLSKFFIGDDPLVEHSMQVSDDPVVEDVDIGRWVAAARLDSWGYRIGMDNIGSCGSVGDPQKIHQDIHPFLSAFFGHIFLLQDVSMGAIAIFQEIALAIITVIMWDSASICWKCMF